jgi:hypothetical protein
MRRKGKAGAKTALTLGTTGFVLIFSPIVGALVSIVSIAMAIREVHRNRDDNFSITVLSVNCVVFALAVTGLEYSLWIGLYGILISPAPP